MQGVYVHCIYLWNSAWFFSRNRYDKDNSNIKFPATRTRTTSANSVVWNGYSVIPWYTSFNMNRKKFCFVMTKILCAVNTNFSVLASSLYTHAYVSCLCSLLMKILFSFISIHCQCESSCRRMPFSPAFGSIAVIRITLCDLCSASHVFGLYTVQYISVHVVCVSVFLFFYLLVYLFCLYLRVCVFVSPLQ